MTGNESGGSLEPSKGLPQGTISLFGRAVEAIVSGEFSRGLPDALGRVELGGVSRQAMQLDFFGVLFQPILAGVVEPVTRPIVDDQEQLPWRIFGDELLEELVECVAVKDRREAVGEIGILERDGSEDVGRLPQSICVDTWLVAYPGPGLVESSIEPETRLVLEEDDSAACGGLFFRAGNRSRSQTACASASARASRFRGRCTENPIWFSRRGT